MTSDSLLCREGQRVISPTPLPLPLLPSKAAQKLTPFSNPSPKPCHSSSPTSSSIGQFFFGSALQQHQLVGNLLVSPALPALGGLGKCIACGSVSVGLEWHGWAGLTAEIGSWLLFDRYIIPAALDLFTKQHAEPQKAPGKKEGVEVEGALQGRSGGLRAPTLALCREEEQGAGWVWETEAPKRAHPKFLCLA